MATSEKLDLAAMCRIAWLCEQAVLHFGAHFDAREFDAMETYFAPDAVWHRADGDIRGVEDLRQRMAARPLTLFVRHVITNLRTQVHSASAATVDSYVTVYRSDGAEVGAKVTMAGPDLMGRYRDEMTFRGERWTIQRRTVTVDFHSNVKR